MFFYVLNQRYKGGADFGYYQCQSCESQYLIAFYEFMKDERGAPNELYIERILRVSFDHSQFMERAGGRRRSAIATR